MKRAIAIAFPNMQPSPFIEGEIRKRAAKLDAQFPGIISCHIVADIPHRHHRKGNLVRVHIQVKVRGRDVTVKRAGVPSTLRRVVREAFDVAARQLRDVVTLRRDVRRQAPRRRPAGRTRRAAEND
jgi:hypothetical protein